MLYDMFCMNDDGSGRVPLHALINILQKTGRTDEELSRFLESGNHMASSMGEDAFTFDAFMQLLGELHGAGTRGPLDGGIAGDETLEGPDPKVLEFLRILEEYRVKCEEEGNYLEAGRAHRQLEALRNQEERRQQRAIRLRQLSEQQEVQAAHSMQYGDFNAAWDRYMDEFDQMAQMYIQQMTERHAMALLEFQKQLRKELASKPPKWSRELLEWRRRQHILARQKNYAEAERIKKVSDNLEEEERRKMEEDAAIVFARREAKLRQQQQSELSALLKRIEGRRREHLKQRALDSKRLLQRNRNVQAVLETKHTQESTKIFGEIKKALTNPRSHSQRIPSSP